MEKYRSLPFAMYDLAVYLPGGVIILVIAKWAIDALLGVDLGLPAGLISNDPKDTIGVAIRAVIWLSASYLVGHLAAFVSTYVVEKFVHNNLGYPADVWLKWERAQPSERSLRAMFAENIAGRSRNAVSMLIIVAQLPAIVPLIALSIWKPLGFYSPKLPTGILDAVSIKYGNIKTGVPLEIGSRWDKIIEHHVANNNELAYSRMYNYLVIYGALRQLSFIILMTLWVLIAYDFRMILEGNFVFSLEKMIFSQSLAFAYVSSAMAFAKFNRRYFEETIMALILGQERA